MSCVYCVESKSDGKTAVVGSADGWILFYDLESNQVTKHQKPDAKPVHSALATSSARHFVTAGAGIYVWDASTGRSLKQKY